MQRGPLIGQGRIAEIFAWGDDQVLKLFRQWCPPDWVDNEARIARTVYQAGAPAPAVGEIIELDGRRGVLLERVYGPSLLDQFSTKPWSLLRAAGLLAELHAALHSITVPELPSLQQRLENKIQSAEALARDVKERALKVLHQMPDDTVLCHGDFHPGNILMSPRGAVIIDWPDAARGHALADVARTSLLMRVGGLPLGTARRWLIQALRALFHVLYLRRYAQLRPASPELLAAWQLPVAAGRLSEEIPDERERVLDLVKASLAVYA